jgi:hypothetical protein
MLRRIVSGVTAGVAVCGVLGLVDGCLTRPVETSPPVTKTNFVTSIPTGSIDKVDLLFDIDNSASMGDKQAYLSQAIPDLITRLVQPNCVDSAGNAKGTATLDGDCSASGPTYNAEFPPVHNMHIGILSSSLGPRLGNACDPTSTIMAPGSSTPLNRHNDDQAHLLARSADPMALTNYTEMTPGPASNEGFLNWFPNSSANMSVTPTGPAPVTDPATLNTDFQSMVVGVHQFGCGIESQLESWYRFLIQPDPYNTLSSAGKRASWVDVDSTILAQRADFLRPDSLVAILVLTDENDSEVDVRSFGGSGYLFMDSTFQPPRGTSNCNTNPADPNCTSCQFPGHSGDSNCKLGPYLSTDVTNWGSDLNLRHVHEKQKYGVSVQFPIQRYVLGLTSPTVPDRNGEYPTDSKGNIASSYQGLVKDNQQCTNPLFAQNLGDAAKAAKASNKWSAGLEKSLCNLTPGTRKPSLVFYAHIGGVPHQLLQVDPTNVDSPQKAALSDADWQLILGKDPENFDYTGIDPHMVESYQSRTTATVPNGGFAVADPMQPTGKDPIAGREWITDSSPNNTNSMGAEHQGLRVDREYACTFKLQTARDCSDSATTADPTLLDSCDCQPPQSGTGTFTHAQVPAVCDDATPTMQDYAKAYPTIRELELAHLLGQVPGANEGIISSLCPIHTTEQGAGDPLYGYRPAMNAIINRLKQALSHQCLPQRLQIDPQTMSVPCLVLATFPTTSGDCASLMNGNGYINPDPQVLKHFQNDQHAQWVQGGMVGDDPSTYLTCELKQLTPNMHCDTGTNNGWCYIDDGSVMGCTQAILFNKASQSSNAITSLQCIESSAVDSGVLQGAGQSSGSSTTVDDAGMGAD